jgi:hypothetical protein
LIEPEGTDFQSDDFLWKLTRNDMSSNCRILMYPNHNISIILLNETQCSLHHNDNADGVDIEYLKEYSYDGGLSTYCRCKDPGSALVLVSDCKRTKVFLF